MKRAIILLCFLSATIAWSQECQRNMLSIPDANGYAKVAKGTLQLPGAFTIEGWVQASTYVPEAGMLEYGKAGDSGIFSIQIGANNTINCSFGFTGGRQSIASPQLSSLLDWNHVAVTFTPNDSIRLYVNGILLTSAKTAATTLRAASGDSLYFGFSPTSGVVLRGAIDEVRIWSLARPQAAIAASKATTYLGNETGLAAYWRFDDDPAFPRFHDFTGRNLNGGIIGSALIVPSSSPVNGPDHPGYMIVGVEKSIDMGTIFCSDPKVAIIHIRNIGPEILDVDGIGFELGGRNVFSISVPPSGLPLPPDPSATATITIQADPKVFGETCDTLIIGASNVCGGKLRIPICVTVVKTEIALSGDVTIFPKEKPYLPCQLPFFREVTISNTGDRNVTIRSLKFIHDIGISLDGVTVPFNLLPGQQRKLTARFDQGADGTYVDTLIAATSECNRTDSLAFEYTRASIAYDLSARSVVFPEERLLPKSTIVRDTDILITNTGTADIYIPEFTIIGAKQFRFRGIQGSAYLSPGQSALVRIRFQSNSCGEFQGAVVVSAPTACGLRDTIHFFIRIRGPEFAPVRATYKLEATCSLPKDTVVGIINRSGAKISITNVHFLRNKFSFVTPPLPAPQVDDGDTFYAKIRFEPLTPGRHADTIRFFTDPCGFVDIAVEGYWGVGEVLLSDTSIEFSQRCDLSSDTVLFKITNTTGKPFSITSGSGTGSPAITLVTPLPISFAPGVQRDLQFVLAPQSFGKYETTFSFTSNSCYVANLTARGIRERATTEWKQTAFDFGVHCPNAIVDVVDSLTNKGFANVLIWDAFTDDPHFSVSNALVGLNIEGGSTLDIPIRFSPDSIGLFTSTLTLVLGPCGDTVRLPLSGIGGPAPDLVVTDTIIAFGNVRIGRSDTFCVQVRNPSCIPILVAPGDITMTLAANGIGITETSLQSLPVNVSADTTLTVCFTFTPIAEGPVQSAAFISAGGKLVRIELSGNGVKPDLAYDPPEKSTIEFGEIEVFDQTVDTIEIRNHGSDTATIASYILSPGYELAPGAPVTILPGARDTIYITFKPTLRQYYIGSLVITWDNASDTFSLRGKGVDPGLIVSTIGVNFGDVRVNHDSSIDVTIKASPRASAFTIKSLQITGVDKGTFDTVRLSGDWQFDSPTDELVYRITYYPKLEKVDTADLVIQHNLKTTSLPLRGRGVEAHLKVIEDTVIFAPSVINGLGGGATLTIRNEGDYPLAFSASTQNYPSIFEITSIPGPIDPRSEKQVSIYFKPVKAVNYLDSLTFFADAPERYDFVYLKGKGTYTPQGDPDITYKIDDAALRVGDIIDLPVYIGGADIALVEADSFYVAIKYDPTVAYVFDTIITENTLSAGMTGSLQYHYADSTIRIGLGGSVRKLREGLLLKLRVEALLGPVDQTRFVVEDAIPRNTGDALLNSGLFQVTNCGDYRTPILLKGPYGISSPQPNPASGIVTLRYELGLDGPVKIRIVDAFGREVKTVVDRIERRGVHQAVFSIEELPSGSYTYEITSLEYRETGKLLIAE